MPFFEVQALVTVHSYGDFDDHAGDQALSNLKDELQFLEPERIEIKNIRQLTEEDYNVEEK